jgi:hypothetical protein
MTNLITIDEFKTYKGIKSESDDPILSLLIGSVSAFTKEYLARDLIEYSSTDKIEYFNAIDYVDYMPEEFPLISVTEVAVSVDGGVTFTALVENTDFFVDSQMDMIISNTVYNGFTSGTIRHKSGRLTYKGGYVNTPLDLKLAVMDLVEYYRKQEYTQSMSIQSASIDNPVVFLPGNHLPPHIRRVFDLYRAL